MSDDITFEDGRCCSLASSPFAWILEQTATCAPSSLSLWLNDLAKRPNGLMSFDVRGLAPNVRADLDASLQRALSAYLSNPENKQHLKDSRVLRGWRNLLETYKRSVNHLPAMDESDALRFDWDRDEIDIHLLWYCPSCTEALTPMPNTSCDKCGWRHPDAADGVQQ